MNFILPLFLTVFSFFFIHSSENSGGASADQSQPKQSTLTVTLVPNRWVFRKIRDTNTEHALRHTELSTEYLKAFEGAVQEQKRLLETEFQAKLDLLSQANLTKSVDSAASNLLTLFAHKNKIAANEKRNSGIDWNFESTDMLLTIERLQDQQVQILVKTFYTIQQQMINLDQLKCTLINDNQPSSIPKSLADFAEAFYAKDQEINNPQQPTSLVVDVKPEKKYRILEWFHIKHKMHVWKKTAHANTLALQLALQDAEQAFKEADQKAQEAHQRFLDLRHAKYARHLPPKQ